MIVSKYSNSFQDTSVVIYQKRKYLKGSTTVAAVIKLMCLDRCQPEDQDSSGTICENAEADINEVEGSTTAKKANLCQLLAVITN